MGNLKVPKGKVVNITADHFSANQPGFNLRGIAKNLTPKELDLFLKWSKWRIGGKGYLPLKKGVSYFQLTNLYKHYRLFFYSKRPGANKAQFRKWLDINFLPILFWSGAISKKPPVYKEKNILMIHLNPLMKRMGFENVRILAKRLNISPKRFNLEIRNYLFNRPSKINLLVEKNLKITQSISQIQINPKKAISNAENQINLTVPTLGKNKTSDLFKINRDVKRGLIHHGAILKGRAQITFLTPWYLDYAAVYLKTLPKNIHYYRLSRFFYYLFTIFQGQYCKSTTNRI